MTEGPAIVRSLRAIAGDRSLLRLEIAYALFAVSEMWVWATALLWAYGSGGARFAGIVVVAQLIPASALASVGSRFVHRFGVPRALAGIYLLQALALAGFAICVELGASRLGTVALASLANVTIAWARAPHYGIATALADGPAEATAANALAGTFDQAGYFIGPLVAGLLVTVSGPAVSIAACAALAAIAAMLVATLLAIGLTDDDEGDTRSRLPRRVIAVLCAIGVSAVAQGCLEIIAVAYAHRSLGGGAASAGALMAATGLGGIIGGVVSFALVRVRRLSRGFILATSLSTVPLIALLVPMRLGAAGALLTVVGIGDALLGVTGATLLQRSVENEVVVRIFAIRESLMLAGMAAGGLLAPALLAFLSPAAAYAGLGVLVMVTVVACLPAIIRMDASSLFRPELTSLLASIEFLSVLPTESLERLAHGAVEQQVLAGHVIIRQGDVGDSYYLIASGECMVRVAGQRGQVTLAAGSGFGEIALLRSIPRTATVTATTDCVLWSIDRELFLDVVAGSAAHERAHFHVDHQLSRLS